jgi:hypothetical protein
MFEDPTTQLIIVGKKQKYCSFDSKNGTKIWNMTKDKTVFKTIQNAIEDHNIKELAQIDDDRRRVLHMFVSMVYYYATRVLQDLQKVGSDEKAFSESFFVNMDGVPVVDLGKVQAKEYWNGLFDHIIMKHIMKPSISVIHVLWTNICDFEQDEQRVKSTFYPQLKAVYDSFSIFTNKKVMKYVSAYFSKENRLSNADSNTNSDDEESKDLSAIQDTDAHKLCSILKEKIKNITDFPELLNGTVKTIDQCKGIIFQGLMLTYYRKEQYPKPYIATIPDLFDFQEYISSTNDKNPMKPFDVVGWIGYEKETTLNDTEKQYLAQVNKQKEKIISLLDDLDDDLVGDQTA